MSEELKEFNGAAFVLFIDDGILKTGMSGDPDAVSAMIAYVISEKPEFKKVILRAITACIEINSTSDGKAE